MGETTSTNFTAWFSSLYGRETPWGGRDIEPLAMRELVPDAQAVA